LVEITSTTTVILVVFLTIIVVVMASLFRRGSTRNRVVAVKESPVGRVRCEMCLEAAATNQNATESTTNSAWSVRVIGFFLLEWNVGIGC